jgi:hypothetical protein
MTAPVLQFGKGTIKIGTTASPTDQFECQISNFTITPSANSIQIPGTYCQGPSIAAQSSTFSIALSYLSDWGETDSLSQLLWDNDGLPLYFTFEPDAPGLPTADGQCYGVAGTFGGEGDGLWQTTSTLPCVSKPTLTPAV